MVPVLAGDNMQSLGSELAVAGGRAILLIGVLMALGKWVLPYIYNEVALGESDEVFVLSSLVIALLAAWLTHSFHLSLALGGFVTGMMLGESPFKYQIDSDIRPFKDILLGLFFVTIGMSLDAGLLAEYWPRILGCTLLLIFIKTTIVALVVKAMRNRRKDAMKVGLTLAQSGEFGLALIALAQIENLVPSDQGSFIILIIIFSMAVSPLLIRYADTFTHLLLGTGVSKHRQNAAIPLHLYHSDHIIIGGFGRVGATIAELMTINDIPYIAIDNDINRVTRCRAQGKNVIYGNCKKVDILTHCHLAEARLAILTFNSLDQAKTTLAHIRRKHIEIPIIVRCRDNADIQELVSLGASHVFPEMLESSLLITSQVLHFLEIDEHVIRTQIDKHRSQLTGL
jgi:CPA2 family monovalent cation:H+ antiporter-2